MGPAYTHHRLGLTFGSKEGVLLAWMRDVGDEVAASVRVVRGKPSVDAVRHALTSIADLYAPVSPPAAVVERLRHDGRVVRVAYREKLANREDAVAEAVAERTGTGAQPSAASTHPHMRSRSRARRS